MLLFTFYIQIWLTAFSIQPTTSTASDPPQIESKDLQRSKRDISVYSDDRKWKCPETSPTLCSSFDHSCYAHSDCPGNHLCCQFACSYDCSRPVPQISILLRQNEPLEDFRGVIQLKPKERLNTSETLTHNTESLSDFHGVIQLYSKAQPTTSIIPLKYTKGNLGAQFNIKETGLNITTPARYRQEILDYFKGIIQLQLKKIAIINSAVHKKGDSNNFLGEIEMNENEKISKTTDLAIYSKDYSGEVTRYSTLPYKLPNVEDNEESFRDFHDIIQLHPKQSFSKSEESVINRKNNYYDYESKQPRSKAESLYIKSLKIISQRNKGNFHFIPQTKMKDMFRNAPERHRIQTSGRAEIMDQHFNSNTTVKGVFYRKPNINKKFKNQLKQIAVHLKENSENNQTRGRNMGFFIPSEISFTRAYTSNSEIPDITQVTDKHIITNIKNDKQTHDDESKQTRSKAELLYIESLKIINQKNKGNFHFIPQTKMKNRFRSAPERHQVHTSGRAKIMDQHFNTATHSYTKTPKISDDGIEDLFDDSIENLYDEGIENLYDDSIENIYDEGIENLYDDSIENLYDDGNDDGEISNTKDGHQKLAATQKASSREETHSYTKTPKISDDGIENLYDGTENLSDDGIENLYDDSIENLYDDSIENLYDDSIENLYDDLDVNNNKIKMDSSADDAGENLIQKEIKAKYYQTKFKASLNDISRLDPRASDDRQQKPMSSLDNEINNDENLTVLKVEGSYQNKSLSDILLDQEKKLVVNEDISEDLVETTTNDEEKQIKPYTDERQRSTSPDLYKSSTAMHNSLQEAEFKIKAEQSKSKMVKFETASVVKGGTHKAETDISLEQTTSGDFSNPLQKNVYSKKFNEIIFNRMNTRNIYESNEIEDQFNTTNNNIMHDANSENIKEIFFNRMNTRNIYESNEIEDQSNTTNNSIMHKTNNIMLSVLLVTVVVLLVGY